MLTGPLSPIHGGPTLQATGLKESAVNTTVLDTTGTPPRGHVSTCRQVRAKSDPWRWPEWIAIIPACPMPSQIWIRVHDFPTVYCIAVKWPQPTSTGDTMWGPILNPQKTRLVPRLL